jgi:hypothetical protein
VRAPVIQAMPNPRSGQPHMGDLDQFRQPRFIMRRTKCLIPPPRGLAEARSVPLPQRDGHHPPDRGGSPPPAISCHEPAARPRHRSSRFVQSTDRNSGISQPGASPPHEPVSPMLPDLLELFRARSVLSVGVPCVALRRLVVDRLTVPSRLTGNLLGNAGL